MALPWSCQQGQSSIRRRILQIPRGISRTLQIRPCPQQRTEEQKRREDVRAGQDRGVQQRNLQTAGQRGTHILLRAERDDARDTGDVEEGGGAERRKLGGEAGTAEEEQTVACRSLLRHYLEKQVPHLDSCPSIYGNGVAFLLMLKQMLDF